MNCTSARKFGNRKLARSLSLWTAAAALLALALAIPAGASAAGSMVVQPDGKILLSSSGESSFRLGGILARFNPDGSLDTGFGAGGGLIDLRMGSPFEATAVQPDGQIVSAAGDFQHGSGEGFVLQGYQSDGSPSPDFGEGGIATGPAAKPGWQLEASAILARADGSVVVGGDGLNTSGSGKAPGQRMIAAQRFNQDGSFAEAIGQIDTSSTPENVGETSLADLLQRADGSLIAAGESNKYGDQSILLGRFVPGSGTPYDTSFAAGAGLSLVNPYPKGFGTPTRVNAVVATTSGLVAAGVAQRRLLLVGYDQKGVVDTSFGEGGFANLPLEGSIFAEATATAVQADGKIVVAGRTLEQCASAAGCWSLVVGRVNPDGSVDKSFGSAGFVRLDLDNGMKPGERLTPEEELRKLVDVAIAADGKILVSETPRMVEGRVLKLARLNADGSLDSGFGTAGIATAAPCVGTAEQLRETGCFSTAQISLRAKGLRGRKPRLRLQLRPSESLDPLRNARLLLPRALRVRKGASGRVRVIGSGAQLTKVRPQRIGMNTLAKAEAVSLVIPRGALKRTRRTARRHKLVFRVQVWFQDGSEQTIVLRRAG